MKLFVTIEVKDFQALERFETQANEIMKKYNGSIIQAYELERTEQGSGVEIHLVEFSTAEKFKQYQQDPRHKELASLRNKAIANIEVKPIIDEKTY